MTELSKELEDACESGNIFNLIDCATVNNIDWELGFKSACKDGITDWSDVLEYTLKYLLDIAPTDTKKN